ncbi:hypothetical protein PSHT_16502 [Puccinia striiformis]|uniref:Uncharacterized protein n=2 Tax=Puccinia striiformis TaxID=27350 RepID=A0A2S4V824_9BASI|nr:hypothetical protein PSHT_16502 [Puccinia striiformis]POW05692.1 hypothetical protein PSTT_09486 [Puccinia striiformis]
MRLTINLKMLNLMTILKTNSMKSRVQLVI